MDAFTHMLIVGPTRCGKTATILKPIIYNLLLLKKKGIPLGLSVVEPKGDLAFLVRELCEEMGLYFNHIDPSQKRGYAIEAGYYDPFYRSHIFNPMQGDEDTVAEATVSVLQSLFGKQEAFFKTVQEVSARNVTKLLKRLQGDKLDLNDVINTLRDLTILESRVKDLIQREGQSDLSNFFESELLGAMRDKYRQFVIGLRAQLENLTSNQILKNIMAGQSEINIDEHFKKGGILAVNTALGELGTSGDAFGQFVIMHLQSGTFRRGGSERTRIPHFLVVDEYSRYINPDVERFLNIAAEYRVAGLFAVQSLGQLEVESGKLSARAVKRAIMGGCRNKIVFGGIGAEDAREFADEFGKKQIIERQATYKTNIIGPNIFPDNYRDTEREEYRYYPTQLMDGLPRFHYVAKLLESGQPMPPAVYRGTFTPHNWKVLREWEDHKQKQQKRYFEKLTKQLSNVSFFNGLRKVKKSPEMKEISNTPTFIESSQPKKIQEELPANRTHFIYTPKTLKGGDCDSQVEKAQETSQKNVPQEIEYEALAAEIAKAEAKASLEKTEKKQTIISLAPEEQEKKLDKLIKEGQEIKKLSSDDFFGFKN